MISVGQYLSQKGFEWRESRGEAVFNCPFCDDKQKKFAVNLTSGVFNCFHLNTCGEKGSFFELQKKLGDQPERLVNQNNFYKPTKKTYKIPEEKKEGISSQVTDYLFNRGFSSETIKRFRIKGEVDTVILPYYREGKLVNNKYRDIHDKSKMWTEKEAEPILFNRDHITGERLFICEGEFDAMAFFEYGINAASVPMGAKNFEWVKNEWDFLERFREIYLCFDQDNAGQNAILELVPKLGSWKCRNVSFPHKDLNDCLKNKVSKEDILISIGNAQDFPPARLASPSDFREEIHNLFENPRSLDGLPTAWNKLTDIIKGWRPGEVTIWSGRSGAGKSTILNQHLIDVIGQGERVCIASLEMPPPRYLRWAIIQQLGVGSPPRHDVDHTLNYFNDKVFIVNINDEVKPNDLFDVFEYSARRYNVKHFIIDSLMRISLKTTDELNSQKEFASQLTSFAKKFNVHCHLVAHPRKGMKDTEIPGKVDVRGTSHLTDLVHNVIMLYRPEAEEKEKNSKVPDMLMMVKKNREFGIEGNIKMKFNSETKTFKEA
jgi:twinkle protein